MNLKFMPYTLAISVGGSSATLATEKILMILFWLMLMKPTVASIKKLILSNRNAVWLSSDSMSRRIWRASSNCSELSILLRIMKLTARRGAITLRRGGGVHHVAADAAVQVFLAGNGAQHLASKGVGHVACQHLLADFLQLVVDVFERVGRILGVGIEQLEQNFLGVLDEARRAACAHAQQAEHRHVFVVDGKQHAPALEVGVEVL